MNASQVFKSNKCLHIFKCWFHKLILLPPSSLPVLLKLKAQVTKAYFTYFKKHQRQPHLRWATGCFLWQLSQHKSIIFIPIFAPQQLQLFRKVSFQSCNANSFLSSAVKAAMWTKFFTALESEMQVDRVRKTSVQKPILQNTNNTRTKRPWYDMRPSEWHLQVR